MDLYLVVFDIFDFFYVIDIQLVLEEIYVEIFVVMYYRWFNENFYNSQLGLIGL